MYVPHYVTTQP